MSSSNGVVSTFTNYLIETDHQKQVQMTGDLALFLGEHIESNKFYDNIPSKNGPKKHVTIAGWSSINKILGISAHIVELKRVEISKKSKAKEPLLPVEYQACCELRSRAGFVVATAWGVCNNNENKRRKSDDMQISSMAQTRAESKANRLLFADVLEHTDYEATGSEEIKEYNDDEIQEKPPHKQHQSPAKTNVENPKKENDSPNKNFETADKITEFKDNPVARSWLKQIKQTLIDEGIKIDKVNVRKEAIKQKDDPDNEIDSRMLSELFKIIMKEGVKD